MWHKFRALCTLILALGSSSCAAGEIPMRLPDIRLPAGFRIELYSDRTPNARSLALGDDGTVYVGTLTEGKVYAVRDDDGDGRSDRVFTIATGLRMPNGVAYLKGDLYIAENHRIVKLPDIAGKLAAPPAPVAVYADLPGERHHGWKYLRVGPDGKLYVPVGAPCNICKPDREIFASLSRLDPDGGHAEIFARGIRNTVGFDWHPQTHELYFTDNGRDWLGDDLPPEELNRADRPGLHFGYPYCHAGTIADPEFGRERPCSDFTGPAWTFPAHVAPLGVRFYQGKQFPESYRNQLFVAQHGSWNRSKPQGYRIVVVKFQNGRPADDETFAQGWLTPDGKASGRPVDLLELADGSLLVSDDQTGAIYRISYRKP